MNVPHGKEHFLENLLLHRVEKISLVLSGIRSFHESMLAVAQNVPAIVTRRQIIRAELHRLVEEDFEFDFAIAKHVGIRRVARFVLVEEMDEDIVPVLAREVHGVVRNVQALADFGDVRVVAIRRARAAIRPSLPSFS